MNDFKHNKTDVASFDYILFDYGREYLQKLFLGFLNFVRGINH